MPYLTLALGDGDDVGSATGVTARLEGGDGADTLSGGTLSGGAGDDALHGTAGIDLLAPGPGADAVHGEGGDDLIDAADGSAPALDRDDGGDGADTVRYGEVGAAARGVTVDLGVGLATAV